MACGNCGSNTTNTCTRCGVSNYCDGKCQTQDWSSHKDTCKDNQLGVAIQRVAHVLHEAYLTFRENTWDTPIRRIVNGMRTLTVYDGDQRQNTTFFVAFPNHMVQNNVQLKRELLTAWTCNEPHGFLHSLIAKLLQGLNVDVSETTVDLKRPLTRSITVIQPSGMPMSNSDYKHDVLHIRSRRPGGRQWVIDHCGAQYGIAQPFHGGAQYFNQYVESTTIRQRLGHISATFTTMAQQSGFSMLVYRLGGLAAEALHAAVHTWETQNVPVSQLRALTGAEFERQKASLLGVLDVAVRTFVATNDFKAVVQRARRGL